MEPTKASLGDGGKGRALASATLRNATVAFPVPRQTGGGVKTVVDRVTLDIEPGEFVCLIGPSGCGKTTVLNLFAGFIPPTQGEVSVGGSRVTKPGPDRPVVFQAQTLFPWLTVFENVIIGPKKRHESRVEYLEQAHSLLSRFGLSDFESYYPHQISGGMQQRVQIARALLGAPKLLLMDEPFGALDGQTRLRMQEHLVAHREAIHCSVLFITHDVDEAIFLADTVYVMSNAPGRLVLRRQIDLPTRQYGVLVSAEFAAIKQELLEQLHSETLEL